MQTRLAKLASRLSKTIKPNLETPTAALVPEDPHQNPDSGDANAVRRREKAAAEKAKDGAATDDNVIREAESTTGFLSSIADDAHVAADMPKSKITSCLQS